jgi:hypothetical protein
VKTVLARIPGRSDMMLMPFSCVPSCCDSGGGGGLFLATDECFP